MKKKIFLVTAILVVLVCSAFTVIADETSAKIIFSDNTYNDVQKSDWFYSSVAYAYNHQIMTGLKEETFAPGDYLARAQFAVIMHRLENCPSIEYSAVFPDVTEGIWYTDAILWANSVNIVGGYENGYFGPADNINREQMAVMMYRYATMKKYNTTKRADLTGYSDANYVNDFSKDAMQWCVAEEIISGKDNKTKLDPQGYATRAECAAIIARFVKKYSQSESGVAIDYKEVYGNLVDQCYIDYGKYNGYYLYDIDKDGIKELLLQEGTCEADYRYSIYTVDIGKNLYLGQVNGFHSHFYQDEGGGREDYIIRASGYMNGEYVEKIRINLLDVETELLYSADYVEEYYSNPYPLTWFSVSDKSGLR